MRKPCLRFAMLAGVLSIIWLAFSGFADEEFLKAEKKGSISFLSGGVGQREREILREKGKNYPLKLIFCNKKGEYLANVVVKILDRDENAVLVTVSNGPWLFVDLPPGTYNLEVSSGGDRKRVPNVKVEKGSQRVVSIQW